MLKFKLLALFLLACALILPVAKPSKVNALELVDVSTHFIQVPAGTFGSGTIQLAATLYQPRFFLSAPAAIYIHGFGGHRLTGDDNLAYYIAASGRSEEHTSELQSPYVISYAVFC